MAILTTYAIPVRRGLWREIMLKDGTTIRAKLRGDAFFHFYQDEEGNQYLRAQDAAYYQPQTTEQLQQRRRRIINNPVNAKAKRHIPIGTERTESLQGTHHELIILVNFSNKQFEEGHDRTLYEQIMNGENFKNTSLGFEGSVRDYFVAQSGGLFHMDFDIIGPITLPHPYSYYGQNDSYYNQDAHPERMIVDAVKAVDKDIDFSKYDNDGDGYVDQVFVLYAGPNESAGGDENTVWPHKYTLSYANAGPLEMDGVKVDDYACSSELTWYGYDQFGNITFGIAGIGTICHEFSHCLGLPDVYDVAYQNYAMCTYSVMDEGEWNGINAPGFTPCEYTAYERMYCGWRQPTELRTDTVIRGMKPISQGGETFIIYNRAHPREYYLLENRQLDGWDRALDAIDDNQKLGLLVTHVDFDPQIWEYNIVNCTDADYNAEVGLTNSHKRLHLLAADNSYAAQKVDPVTQYEYYDYADVQGDLFPYGTLDSLTNLSSPRPTLYNIGPDGTRILGIGILNIRQNSDGTIDFDFRASSANSEQTDEVYFYESFDQCQGMGGNDDQWGGTASIGSAPLRADHDGWSGGTINGADKCARIGATRNITKINSPVFAINGTATVTFRAAPWQGDPSQLTLSLYSDEDSLEGFSLSQTEFNLLPNEWNECTTTLTGYGKVQLCFGVQRRAFIDEVRVQAGSTNDVEDIRSITPTPSVFYGIDGRRYTSGENLPRGIFISSGRKVIK